jgi:hypothetical protein
MEYLRIKVDLVKWLVGGVVLIIGFLMIRPQKQARLDRALQLEVHKAYLSATNTSDVELWQRKLKLMKAMVEESDAKIQGFIAKEQGRIDDIRGERERLAQAEQERTAAMIADAKVQKEKQRVLDELARASSAERVRLEEEKRALEEQSKFLEAEKQQSVEKEEESARKLESFGYQIQQAPVTRQLAPRDLPGRETLRRR